MQAKAAVAAQLWRRMQAEGKDKEQGLCRRGRAWEYTEYQTLRWKAGITGPRRSIGELIGFWEP